MLRISGLSKTFNIGTVNEKTALQDISLDVKDGDFITIVGSNGAGKSTLFNAIAGDFLPDQGKIILDGTNITFTPSHKRAKYIGRLFQDPLRGTAPHMTIEENLALAYLRAGHSGIFSRITKADEEAFKDQLRQLDLGLEERLHSPVGTLSGGQRQALTLLMATIVPPRILLMDEHTAALDPQAAGKIMTLSDRIIKEHRITCLMITHNLEQALTYGNRTLMMAEGRIVLDLEEEQRKSLSVDDLLHLFRQKEGRALDNDRILLSKRT
ncbi:MAG: ATP-binding cassette domain-containing protein [Solobacterium sp.]|nr:ATP-binding cassette domain-containing protein [Solobacterium sp.]